MTKHTPYPCFGPCAHLKTRMNITILPNSYFNVNHSASSPGVYAIFVILMTLISALIFDVFFQISRLLFGIDMPDDVIGETINAIACTFCHLGKAFRLCLIFKRVTREVDAGAMHICFDNDVDAADTVESDFLVLVFTPIAHCGHIFALCGIFVVALCKNHVLIERRSEL